MKNLGIVITDGVGFRNFILSDFLNHLEDGGFNKVIIFSFLPQHVYANHTNLEIIELEALEESFVTWFFRKAKEIAHLKNNAKDNFGIQDALKVNRSKQKTPRGIATRFIFRVTSIFHSEKTVTRFQRLQNWSFKSHAITKKYRQILKNEEIDFLFFTHQRPPYIAPLVYEANKMKIKTSAFIFSWDNIASKGRMSSNFDFYLVWSDLMKQELMEFYRSIRDEQVKVVGTPQFEPYILDHFEISKEDFVSSYNLDPKLKTICFSCGDISTSRNDELYISTIADAIDSKKIQDINLIVRTSPAEDPIRFQDFVERYPFIRWDYPKWKLTRKEHQESWSQRIPTNEDVENLRAILAYSDLNINMLSTMSLDFMLFDKPVINPVFGNAENELYDDQRFLNYAHIRHLVNSESSKIVTNEDELISSINEYLESDKDSQNRQDFVKQQIGVQLKDTSEFMKNALISWMQ